MSLAVFVCLSVDLPVPVSVSLSLRLSACLTVNLLVVVCHSVCLSVSFFTCLHICLSVHPCLIVSSSGVSCTTRSPRKSSIESFLWSNHDFFPAVLTSRLGKAGSEEASMLRCHRYQNEPSSSPLLSSPSSTSLSSSSTKLSPSSPSSSSLSVCLQVFRCVLASL